MSGWGSIYNQTQWALRLQTQTLARLQEQAASGSRVIRASDDPTSANQILALRHDEQRLGDYAKTIQRVEFDLDQASSVLEQISDSLTRARELTSQAASASYNQANRRIIAQEVDSLLEQILSQTNTRNVGRYLFGGAASQAAPYVAQRNQDGQITSVQYQGSQNPLTVAVADGVDSLALMPGDRLFRQNARQAPVFLGNTGLAAGSGTATVRGDAWVTLTHTASAYAPGAGLTGGASSSGGDTILGPHTLLVQAGGIALDDGDVVAIDITRPELRLTNKAGDVLYVDARNYNGFVGTLSVTGQGTISLDDGTTAVAIDDFTQRDLTVTNSLTGQTLSVRLDGVQRVGVEPVRVAGTADIFSTLVNLRDLLNNDWQFSSDKQGRLLGDMLPALEGVAEQLSRGQTTIGARQQALDSLSTTLQTAQDGAKAQADSIQQVDVADLATSLARTQTLYEMTLASTAKLLQMSLLDYL